MDKTLAKGLAVLEYLVESPKAQGVSQVARQLGLSKSTAHRLLQTLSRLGYSASSEGKYYPTPKLWVLGASVISRLDVRRLAMANLEKLGQDTLETVHLSILDRDEVVYIEQVESPQPLRTNTKIGGRAPAYCVATGKALLAYESDEIIDLVSRNLIPYTDRTIVDADELLRELERIRQAGWALNGGEWREQIEGIASPIFDSQDTPIAALGISGPSDRVNAEAARRLAPIVCSAAKSVSRKMGGDWSRAVSSREAVDEAAGA